MRRPSQMPYPVTWHRNSSCTIHSPACSVRLRQGLAFVRLMCGTRFSVLYVTGTSLDVKDLSVEYVHY